MREVQCAANMPGDIVTVAVRIDGDDLLVDDLPPEDRDIAVENLLGVFRRRRLGLSRRRGHRNDQRETRCFPPHGGPSSFSERL